MKVGYIRVSTEEQNTVRQEVLMGLTGSIPCHLRMVVGDDVGEDIERAGISANTF